MIDDAELARRAAAIEWLVLDVDGVLTDGRLVYGPEGEALKVFHVRDGLALRMARRTGLKVGILSGRSSPPIAFRARELGVDELILGRSDKGVAFAEFLARQGTDPERVAYAGDDLPDLPVLRRAGLGFAPADAAAEVRAVAHVVLDAEGGRAAVRELIERLLRARGAWEAAVAEGFGG